MFKLQLKISKIIKNLLKRFGYLLLVVLCLLDLPIDLYKIKILDLQELHKLVIF